MVLNVNRQFQSEGANMIEKEIDTLGYEIDLAIDEENKDELYDLIEKCDRHLLNGNIPYKSIVYLYKANIYDALSRFDDEDAVWGWHQKYKIYETLELRKAVVDAKFCDLPSVHKCKIYTNLACNLSRLGRYIEAIKCYDSAMKIIPNFAMAICNRAVTLIDYALSLYDDGHALFILNHAVEQLNKIDEQNLYWDSGFHELAVNSFKERKKYANSILNSAQYTQVSDLNQWSLGDSNDEKEYRRWCLKNSLFLSPLNDICSHSIAAHDVIHLPSHKYSISDDIRYPKYFNILKQEFVFARHVYYLSMSIPDEHYADNDILLYNGFDGVRFGYKREQLKTAYRVAYSLFDKIAIFINEYYQVGLKTEFVSFRKIWGKCANKQQELYKCFDGIKNMPLQGLYYLSKDLFDSQFIDNSLPEAEQLSDLRNRVEHRFLNVQEYAAEAKNTDNILYVTADDLEKKTMKVLSMAREAIIYLSLSMYVEEKSKESDDEFACILPAVRL